MWTSSKLSDVPFQSDFLLFQTQGRPVHVSYVDCFQWTLFSTWLKYNYVKECHFNNHSLLCPFVHFWRLTLENNLDIPFPVHCGSQGHEAAPCDPIVQVELRKGKTGRGRGKRTCMFVTVNAETFRQCQTALLAMSREEMSYQWDGVMNDFVCGSGSYGGFRSHSHSFLQSCYFHADSTCVHIWTQAVM